LLGRDRDFHDLSRVESTAKTGTKPDSRLGKAIAEARTLIDG